LRRPKIGVVKDIEGLRTNFELSLVRLIQPIVVTIEMKLKRCWATIISVNECDPLRDEGIAFYRLLLASGVSARCRQMMGACHAVEILPVICPDIGHV
jgi:acetyl esterase/lipase